MKEGVIFYEKNNAKMYQMRKTNFRRTFVQRLLFFNKKKPNNQKKQKFQT